ncbi:MAG: thymidine phosphorylase [Actinobacteria bacterium]|nr:thymidine phosphorylase [Actinomycetota bacterium]
MTREGSVAGDPRDLIAAKRDGLRIEADELRTFVLAYARGELPDYQAAALLMAAFIKGLDGDETLALTRAMVDSGESLALAGISRPKVDKHSTGGVADGVTLAFAPLAAALGLAVAKLSGRGLGHTGGTLDKLESIPGLRTDLDPAAFERQVEEVGSAVAAQSADLVPADGALYALRDATATVPSIPLIAASVMSKKLAVGTDLVLLDVKAGSGAFMKTPEDAAALAQACTALAADWGRPTRAAVTDMSQPLGSAIGNALDIVEAVALLRGEMQGRLRDAAVIFAGEALSRLSGDAMGEARARAASALDSGDALEAFRRMVEAQGGDPRVVDDPEGVLPAAPVRTTIGSDRSGTLSAVDAEGLGRASGDLGAGRKRKGDPIDPAVGIVFRPKIGDRLEMGQELGEIHARTDEDAERCLRAIRAAITIADGPVEAPPLVYGWHG